MVSILLVKNKDVTGDGKEFTEVLRAVAKTKSHKKLTIHWSLDNLVKIYYGTIEPQHFIHPRQMALLKEPYDE